MNYAVEISDDSKTAIVIAENGGACTITNDGSVCIVRMFQDKIEKEYDDDTFELLSQGRVYLRRFPGGEVTYEMIEYCVEWLMPFADSYEIPFYDLINQLNKNNNMNGI